MLESEKRKQLNIMPEENGPAAAHRQRPQAIELMAHARKTYYVGALYEVRGSRLERVSMPSSLSVAIRN